MKISTTFPYLSKNGNRSSAVVPIQNTKKIKIKNKNKNKNKKNEITKENAERKERGREKQRCSRKVMLRTSKEKVSLISGGPDLPK